MSLHSSIQCQEREITLSKVFLMVLQRSNFIFLEKNLSIHLTPAEYKRMYRPPPPGRDSQQDDDDHQRAVLSHVRGRGGGLSLGVGPPALHHLHGVVPGVYGHQALGTCHSDRESDTCKGS